AGEKGAAINNLAAIISSARSGMVDAGMKMVGDGLRSLGEMAQNVPDPVYDVASVALGLSALAFEVGSPIGWGIAGASLAVSGASTYKMYSNGASGEQVLINGVSAAAGPFVSPLKGFQINKATMLYNHLRN
ncbi:hypothetical protein EB093_09920, partial [bacterium]|nr:hypothetical protein [bacterium]